MFRQDFHIGKYDRLESNEWFDVQCTDFSDDSDGVLKSLKTEGAKFTSIQPFKTIIDVTWPEINLDKDTIQLINI